jgi:5'-phosphate synthase pdxT subunit
MTTSSDQIKIGVLALQGAFEEHQMCLEKSTICKTVQIRTPDQLEDIDGIIFPGGESTAIGLIGSHGGMWSALKDFMLSGKPVWGTCAGMVLLAERCVGGSAVIENGQSLIGGMDVLVCRNYFGSQISSFEMKTPCPPGFEAGGDFPGVFIRAPSILSVGEGIDVLGKVVATPCRQAAVVLRELEERIARGENVVMMGVVDSLERTNGLKYVDVKRESKHIDNHSEEEKKETEVPTIVPIELPGASDGTNAREVICAARRDNILITAFHPELTDDYRWHQYFFKMVEEYKHKLLASS